MQAINVSIGVDQRLWAQDLRGSRAHCRMLIDQGIVTAEDGAAILGGLDAVQAEFEAGTFPFRDEYEDIHLNVEARSRSISACGCATHATGRWPSFRRCNGRC